jgi:hypothetical protein
MSRKPVRRAGFSLGLVRAAKCVTVTTVAVPPAQDRETRAGENQVLFREVNERIDELNEAFRDFSAYGSWVCECANETCVERIELTLAEYGGVRAVPERFAVKPGESHVWPDIERVVEKHDRYWVVEKTGDAARIAAEAYDRRGA